MPRVNPMRLLIMAIGLYTTCYCFVNGNRVCFLVMFEDSNIRFSNPVQLLLRHVQTSGSGELLNVATPASADVPLPPEHIKLNAMVA